MFSVVHAALLHPVVLPNATRLVGTWETNTI